MNHHIAPSRVPKSSTLVATLATLAVSSPLHAQVWETCTPLRTTQGEAAGDNYGFIARSIGDADLDGVQDYIISAHTSSAGGPAAGRVWVYSGATGSVMHTVTGLPGDLMGYAANRAGDVNNDGHGDYMVGAPRINGASAGYAQIFSGADQSLLYLLAGSAPNDQFGRNLGAAGDVNGDGFDDVLIAATNAFAGAGQVTLYSGIDGSNLQSWTGTGLDMLGSALCGLGDLDGDGFGEFLIGASGGGTAGRGQAVVYDGQSRFPLKALEPDSGGVNFAMYMCGSVGDLNGDTVPDFFVSDFNHAVGGRVYVYSGIDFQVLYTVDGEAPGDVFGTGPGLAGDVDKDGVNDLVFGALGNDQGGNGAGQMRIVSGVDGSPLGRFTGDTAGVGLGFSCTGVGDVDGDSEPDFIFTSPSATGATGVAHLISGGAPHPPRNFCVSSPNSVGPGTRMDYRKAPSLGINNFRIRAQGSPASTPGQFLYGANPAALPFGDGVLCIGVPRARVGAAVQTNVNGSAFTILDLQSGPLSTGAGAIQAGTTWHFQFWYRDPAGPLGSGFNLSDGLTVTFCP